MGDSMALTQSSYLNIIIKQKKNIYIIKIEVAMMWKYVFINKLQTSIKNKSGLTIYAFIQG